MADKPWKQFERDAAALICGKRKWANSGERLDIESENFIGQCKLVQKLSLAQLTALAVEMANATTDKFGVVMTKLRAGKGKKTPMLVTMTADQFEALLMHPPFPSEYEQEAQKELDDRDPRLVKVGPNVMVVPMKLSQEDVAFAIDHLAGDLGKVPDTSQ